MAAEVTVIAHPFVQHKLTLMRQADTSTTKFRQLLKEIGMLLAYEVTRDLPLKYEEIKTPLAPMLAPMLAPEKKMVVVSIMRAGLGLLDGILELMPSARVGHIGLYRDPTTYVAIEYYFKLPQDVEHRDGDGEVAQGEVARVLLEFDRRRWLDLGHRHVLIGLAERCGHRPFTSMAVPSSMRSCQPGSRIRVCCCT